MTKVITGETRWSYANVWEPKAMVEGAQAKYSVSLIIPKSDKNTIERINNAIKEAYNEGLSKLKGNSKSVPSFENIKKPLRDGDTEREGDPAYANSYFVNANSPNPPGIIGPDKMDILNHREVYSGCYGKASITFYAYNANGSRGIACALNNLMKTRDGEPLGSKATAEDDFADEDLLD